MVEHGVRGGDERGGRGGVVAAAQFFWVDEGAGEGAVAAAGGGGEHGCDCLLGVWVVVSSSVGLRLLHWMRLEVESVDCGGGWIEIDG